MPSSGWMLTEWIGLNSIVCTCIASICSEYFYTYTIYTLECIYLFCILIYFKYTVHLCTCMHLFVQASAIPCTRCSYICVKRAAPDTTDSHLWGNYGASFTLIHLWGIVYNYALTLIHIYTYVASYTMQQIETSTQPCAMHIVHVIHACATTRYHRFALMELLCMCWSKYPGANIGDTCASTDSHREACRANKLKYPYSFVHQRYICTAVYMWAHITSYWNASSEAN